MDGEQSRRRLQAHLVDDERAPVATLGDVLAVAEDLHQLRPGSSHALGAPAGARRLPREPVARHGRDDQVKCVSCARTVRRGIGQSIDDLQLLNDRSWPSVIDDERQRALMPRPDVDEVDVQPVDLGDELRQRVQVRLDRPPVVVRHPVARELLDHRERYALRLIRHGLRFRPPRGGDASTQIVQCLIGHVDVEWADLDRGLDGGGHERPPFVRSDAKAPALGGEQLRPRPDCQVVASVQLGRLATVSTMGRRGRDDSDRGHQGPCRDRYAWTGRDRTPRSAGRPEPVGTMSQPLHLR